MASVEKLIDEFRSVFRGNPLFFTKHQPPFEQKEGKLKAKWCGFSVYNKRNPPPPGYEIGDLIPLTAKHYEAHLKGEDALAVSPIMNVTDADGNIVKRNVCYFAVIDIDVYGVVYDGLINSLNKFGFQFIPILSKSGGLHLYFFFREAEPAAEVINVLSKIVETFGLNKLYVNSKKKSKVEIFPKQATFIPGDKNANCIFLPFYGNKLNKMIVANKLVGIDKALPIIDGKFTTIKELKEVLERLPYSDAPFCIQMILLTGALKEGDSRNNFLFSAGVYLKKKYMDNFLSYLAEMNGCLETPLDYEEVESIYKSLTNKDRNYESFSCKKSPCCDYCDKTLCREREYAPGKDRGGQYTGVNCWGLLTKYMAVGSSDNDEAEYYTWEIQVEDGGEFRNVRIDNVKDFENQSAIRTACRRDLNWSPGIVSPQKWIDITNHAMLNIVSRTVDVAKGTETSEEALFRNAVYRYLTHKQIRNRQPFLIKTGQVYKDGNGWYHFTTDGLLRYLTLEKVSLHKMNVHVKLLSLGCVEGEVIHKTSRGIDIRIPCWKKEEDEELALMDIFYEDIYEGDTDILQKKEGQIKDGDINF